MSQMGKFISAGTLGGLEYLTGNVGGAIAGDGLGNIDITGTTPVTVTGTPATHSLAITVDSATTTAEGIIEIATNAESIAGSATDLAIVPSSLEAKLGALTANSVPYGAGTGSALSWMTAGTDGQVIIAATAGAPAFASITSTGGTVAITPGANTLNLELSGTVTNSFPTDAGTATPAAGALTVAGGNNISTAGAGSTVTINVSGTTQYALQVGDATGSLDSLAVGTATQVLQSSGAGVNPAWSTATYPATSTQGDVLYSSAANTIVGLAKSATATRYLANTGASNNPAWDQVNMANGVTGTLPVTNGGTGLATITDHSVLVGSGTGAITPITVGTDGQVLLGSSAADPVFASLTSSGATIAFTPGAGTLNLETGSAVAVSFVTDAGTAVPVTGSISIVGGTNCNTAGSGSTITINSSGGGGGGITWNEVTGTSQSAVANNGYITNNVALVTVTLPSTASVGDTVRILGLGGGGWRVAQNASQYIRWDESNVTTTGVGGYLDSTDDNDAVELICTVVNNGWGVATSKGNITIA